MAPVELRPVLVVAVLTTLVVAGCTGSGGPPLLALGEPVRITPTVAADLVPLVLDGGGLHVVGLVPGQGGPFPQLAAWRAQAPGERASVVPLPAPLAQANLSGLDAAVSRDDRVVVAATLAEGTGGRSANATALLTVDTAAGGATLDWVAWPAAAVVLPGLAVGPEGALQLLVQGIGRDTVVYHGTGATNGTWSTAAAVLPGANGLAGPAVLADGTVVGGILDHDAGAWRVVASRAGGTWDPIGEVAAGSPHGTSRASLVALGGQRLAFVGSHGAEGRASVVVARSQDGGSSWSEPEAVALGPGFQLLPGAALAGDRLVVAWYDQWFEDALAEVRWTVRVAALDATTLEVLGVSTVPVGAVHEGRACPFAHRCAPLEHALGDRIGVAATPRGGALVAFTATGVAGGADPGAWLVAVP